MSPPPLLHPLLLLLLDYEIGMQYYRVTKIQYSQKLNASRGSRSVFKVFKMHSRSCWSCSCHDGIKLNIIMNGSLSSSLSPCLLAVQEDRTVCLGTIHGHPSAAAEVVLVQTIARRVVVTGQWKVFRGGCWTWPTTTTAEFIIIIIIHCILSPPIHGGDRVKVRSLRIIINTCLSLYLGAIHPAATVCLCENVSCRFIFSPLKSYFQFNCIAAGVVVVSCDNN